MIRINLLPHREETRTRQKRQFIGLLGIGTVIGLFGWGIVHLFISEQISHQMSRNDFLKKENVRLDKEIEEIKKLKEEISALLARKQVIETLQADRAQSVQLLDELVTVNKIPFFGDLPGIEVLFRNNLKIDNKRELLVFITPRIVDDRLSIR